MLIIHNVISKDFLFTFHHKHGLRNKIMLFKRQELGVSHTGHIISQLSFPDGLKSGLQQCDFEFCTIQKSI